MNNLAVSKGNHTKRAGFSALFPNYMFTISEHSLPPQKRHCTHR